MESITKQTNGRKTVQFKAADGRRRSIRLGKISQRLAEQIRDRIDALDHAAIASQAPTREVAQWVTNLGDALHAKLASVGLIEPRVRKTLKAFLDGYAVQRPRRSKSASLQRWREGPVSWHVQ